MIKYVIIKPMKTTFLKIFFLISILSFSFCFAKDNIKNNNKFKKLSQGLYFNTNSLSKNKDVATGWFKKENDNGIRGTKTGKIVVKKSVFYARKEVIDNLHKLKLVLNKA